jgi:hypothetical protein
MEQKDMKFIDAFCRSLRNRNPFLISLFLCVAAVVSLSCGSKPTDPRTVIPADSLVYLETSDLGKVLDAITSNQEFQQLAKTKPDTSALNGISLSIAVTGFQTSEEPAAEGNAVLNFKPHFVAVAETNAWNYQALSFAENKLGEFINEIYGGEIELVTTDKHGGKYFTWTAQDGRKAYALVRGSLILFGNDETAIERSVGVQGGEGESIAKNSRVSAFATDSLASGYISKDGVGQIANIAGLSFATGASEEGEVQSFIARVLPEVVRNSVIDAVWTARRLENGRVEDNYTFTLADDAGKVFTETIVPGADPDSDLSRFVPKELVSTTRYNLKDAQIAWRSVLLTTQSKTDMVSGNLLTAFSSSLFEPYGVDDAEMFLGSVGNALQTVRFDAEGEEVAVITRIRDLEKLKRSLAKEINTSKAPTAFENAQIWRSEDGELVAAIVEGNSRLVLGESASVEKCLKATNSGESLVTIAADGPVTASNAVVVTTGDDTDSNADLIKTLSDRKDNSPLVQSYVTETRFNQKGIERRTVSAFGLIGTIIGKLEE